MDAIAFRITTSCLIRGLHLMDLRWPVRNSASRRFTGTQSAPNRVAGAATQVLDPTRWIALRVCELSVFCYDPSKFQV